MTSRWVIAGARPIKTRRVSWLHRLLHPTSTEGRKRILPGGDTRQVGCGYHAPTMPQQGGGRYAYGMADMTKHNGGIML